jgi:lambda family phage portal protein
MARRSLLRTAREAIGRVIYPEAFAVRRFDGASGRRGDQGARFGRVPSETLGAAPQLRSKARYYAENNAWAQNGVRALKTFLVGAGIQPASTHPDAVVRKMLGERFAAWALECDFDGRTDLGGLEAQAVGGMVVDGEAFLRFVQTSEGLRLQLLAPELIDESKTTPLADGGYCIAGVEFDSQGRRRAYWILPEHPQNAFSTLSPSVRVPAEDIIHLFAPVTSGGAGQVRGASWLASALLRLGEIDQLEDALLVGAKVAAMHTGFIQDELGTSGLPLDGDATGNAGELEVSMEPGTVRRLGPGQKITFNTPQQAAQGVEFLATQLRALSASLGVAAHMLDNAVERANYSSLRAALSTFAARCEQVQYGVLIPQLMRPIWRRWLTTEILSGRIDAPDFESRTSDWLGVEFYPPAPPVADPYKQTQSDALMVEKGFASRRQIVARQGYSIEEVDEDRAADTAASEPSEEEPEA